MYNNGFIDGENNKENLELKSFVLVKPASLHWYSRYKTTLLQQN